MFAVIFHLYYRQLFENVKDQTKKNILLQGDDGNDNQNFCYNISKNPNAHQTLSISQ